MRHCSLLPPKETLNTVLLFFDARLSYFQSSYFKLSHYFQSSQSSPRRVAVPVLVKDGKPISGGNNDDPADHPISGSGLLDIGVTSGAGHHLSNHHHHHHVKAEYASHVGLLNSTVDDLNNEMAVAVGGPLPALMHMGYGGHRHLQDPSQSSMCSYLQHRTAW